MHNPLVAIFLAALAAWVFGAAWYGALGRTWMEARGLAPAEIDAHRQAKAMPLGPMAVSFLCELVMAWALLQVLPFGEIEWYRAAAAGAMLGIGFMATTTLVNNMFQQRRAMLSVIDGAHWIGVAAIEAVVLAALI